MTKLKTSVLFAVLVIVGAVPPAQSTEAGHVTVKAVPLALSKSVKLPAVPLAGGFEIVRLLMFALSVTGPKTLAKARFRVRLPLLIVGALAVSL